MREAENLRPSFSLHQGNVIIRPLSNLFLISKSNSTRSTSSPLFVFMQGFAPADDLLLFRQKEAKPFLPVRGPSDPAQSRRVSRVPPPPSRIMMAQELVPRCKATSPLKQPSPRSRFGTPAPPRPTQGKTKDLNDNRKKW